MPIHDERKCKTCPTMYRLKAMEQQFRYIHAWAATAKDWSDEDKSKMLETIEDKCREVLK